MSASPADPAAAAAMAAPSIVNTYGLTYLGVVIAALLYGISLVQTYMYYEKYEEDRWTTKGFVALLFALDTTHMVIIVYAMWYYLIDCFLQPAKLLVIEWPMFTELGLTILITLLVQLFFAQRIHILTKKWWISGSVVVLSIMQFGFASYFISVVARGDRLWSNIVSHTWSTDVSLAVTVAADLIIAVAMFSTLRSHRSEFANTRQLINELISYAIGTGILTTTVSIFTLVFFATSTSFISSFFYFLLSKLYTNSVLVQLNSRQRMRDMISGGSRVTTGGSGHKDTSVRLTDLRNRHGNPSSNAVRIDVDTVIDGEEDYRMTNSRSQQGYLKSKEFDV